MVEPFQLIIQQQLRPTLAVRDQPEHHLAADGDQRTPSPARSSAQSTTTLAALPSGQRTQTSAAGALGLPGLQLPRATITEALLQLLRMGRWALGAGGPQPLGGGPLQQAAVGAMGLLQKGHPQGLLHIGLPLNLQSRLAALFAVQGQGVQRQTAEHQQR